MGVVLASRTVKLWSPSRVASSSMVVFAHAVEPENVVLELNVAVSVFATSKSSVRREKSDITLYTNSAPAANPTCLITIYGSESDHNITLKSSSWYARDYHTDFSGSIAFWYSIGGLFKCNLHWWCCRKTITMHSISITATLPTHHHLCPWWSQSQLKEYPLWC